MAIAMSDELPLSSGINPRSVLLIEQRLGRHEQPVAGLT
jgi:hypothetical protein